jgi:hypothetical protein
MAVTTKDTIYIDIDDEITSIIDKLRVSDAKVLALVLPKRAAVLQSVVNMKLLKRAADEAKKHVVLITSEAGLLPLAGMVGLHVAKTLTSKPEIPLAPKNDEEEETVEELTGESPVSSDAITPETVGAMSVGALAGMAAAKDEVETVQLDDAMAPSSSAGDEATVDGESKRDKKKKEKKNKKDSSLHVPNFNRFRLFLILFILIVIILIGLAVFAMKVLPKATVNITTDATNINASVSLNLSTNANSISTASNTIPATLVQQQKTYTQEVATTGQQNEGQAARGSITMSAEECAPNLGQTPADVPAGAGVTSNNLTYITQQDTSFNFEHFSGGNCAVYGSSPTPIEAQSPGSNYNTNSSASFDVAGRSDVTANASSAISGGTDDIVQIVSQTDINNAKAKITADNDSAAKQILENQAQGQDLYAISATFSSGTPTVTNSANVGTAASSVTVTEVINYTMFGVHKSDLQTLVNNAVDSQINTSKQSILSDGLDNASFSVQNSSSTTAQLSMTTVAEAGPELDVSTIQQEVAGKKSADAQAAIESNPDVTGVSVKLSPFFVDTVPTKTSKITVTIAKPTKIASSSNANNP